MRHHLPNREHSFTDWYAAVIKRAQLAEHAPVRGAMIIRPYGYALWEQIQAGLDREFKEQGIQNAYFPLFIPLSFLSKEAEHVEGFAKECAVVTHHRLTLDKGKKIIPDPTAKLEEPFVIRPTSETLIWERFSKWIQSYRDLPLRLNQWANIVRWELRPRLFLRTTEILWQEGHTAYPTEAEANQDAQRMCQLYADFLAKMLAIPVIKGVKTAHERFAGAAETYTIEALLQDGKALQAGTSHFLGQNFGKAFQVKYTDMEGQQQYVWGTSWGVTTRLIGCLIMTHGDDKGLVLPPKIAPTQVMIIPLLKKKEATTKLIARAKEVQEELRAANIRTEIDLRAHCMAGFKFTEQELKGIPLRIVIGQQELEKSCLQVTRRDNDEQLLLPLEDIATSIQEILTSQQDALLARATKRRERATYKVDSYELFKKILSEKKGFLLAHWDGTIATEKKIQEETGATIRCIPSAGEVEKGRCIYTGKPSQRRVLFAQAY